MKRKGFTLIELLIVVAIIAILAAIAVPNFLEAQTRSRVSRAQNDMRSIALAMESYRIDNNTYPSHFRYSPLPPASTSTSMDSRLLSTPVSYLTVFPDDVFRIIAGSGTAKYRLYALGYTARSAAPGYNRDYHFFPKTSWMTWSLGPDLVTNTGGYFPEPAVIANEASAAPRIGIDKNGVTIPPATSLSYNGMRYDPTNGTVSWGDIYRFEGEAKTRIN
ncbi:MAG: prepilin-type N-terminal cleavage/methylation domain-containing protein [Candidatus Sumerlaeia bacterium]